MEFLTGSAGGTLSEELPSMERWTKKDSLQVSFLIDVFFPVLVNCFLGSCFQKILNPYEGLNNQ